MNVVVHLLGPAHDGEVGVFFKELDLVPPEGAAAVTTAAPPPTDSATTPSPSSCCV